jgi:hypothetical protein
MLANSEVIAHPRSFSATTTASSTSAPQISGSAGKDGKLALVSVIDEIDDTVDRLVRGKSISHEYEKNIRVARQNSVNRGRPKDRYDLDSREAEPPLSIYSAPSQTRERSTSLSKRGRSFSPLHTKEGGAMAAQARHRRERSLQRPKSCGAAPKFPSAPWPGCLAFDACVNEGWKNALCVKKRESDDGLGLFDHSPPPREKYIPEEELANVIPRKVEADWIANLCIFKQEYESEQRGEIWTLPHPTKEMQPQPMPGRTSSLHQLPYMDLNSQMPIRTEECVTGLFGHARTEKNINPNYGRFSRQHSTPLLMTRQLFQGTIAHHQ